MHVSKMLKIYQLKNNLKVVLNHIDGVHSVSAGIFVGAGSVNETTAENGISHFTEHVTFKGTKKRTSYDISHDSEMIGADVEAYTTRNLTCYYARSTSERAAETFEILADIFLDSVYPAEELDKERGVIIQEIDMYDDTPEDVCSELLLEAYFGKGGYGAHILGTKENVGSFTTCDVFDYRHKFYNPDNIVLSISGNFRDEEFIPLIERYFGALENIPSAVKPEVNKTNLCQSLASEKDINQVHIALGFPSVGLISDDLDAFNLAVYILGGGMSSRLFQVVREKLGLCYNIYSYLTAYVDCGFGMIYVGVDKKSIAPAYEAILNEITLLKRDKITDEEFTKCYEQMKSGIVFAQESVSAQMQLYGKQLLLKGKCIDFAERLNRLDKLSKNDVNGLIDRFFDPNYLSKAIVGKNVKPL